MSVDPIDNIRKKYNLMSRQSCNVVKNLIYYFHIPHKGVGYDEIYHNTFRRRTRKTNRTHCQGQAKISNNPHRADSTWM